MAIGSNGNYKAAIDPDFNFAMDQSRLTIIKKGEDGTYRPIRILLEDGDPIAPQTVRDEIPYSLIPNELAELLFSLWAKYYLSPEGDLVETNKRLQRDYDRVSKQLSDLIAGIGRLGGNSDSQH